ncbi:MAG: hypothetical protein K0S11_824 [Gammaproteobacteria bacterium]|jgi:glutathione peroxidase|nr:hypothetical protein [Gammaproteobacteria bacterium]
MPNLYDYTVTNITGETISLSSYQGKTLLIVNVASQCGFTQQYAELEQLYQDFKTRGLVVLAFPCNQFGGQEPGSNAEIQQFCTTKYQLSFPLLAKIEVNGEHAHPLFKFLTAQAPGFLGSRKIKWNFTKFLVDSKGKVVRRYAPSTKPSKISKDLLKLL